MATSTRASASASDLLKWSFFAVMALGALLVVWTDERFWLNPADPHWNHIAHVEGLLAVHGLAEVTALLAGAVQMSSRIRSDRPALHRALGKIYIAAVCISAPVAIYMGTSRWSPSASASSRSSRAASGYSARWSPGPASAAARCCCTRHG